MLPSSRRGTRAFCRGECQPASADEPPSLHREPPKLCFGVRRTCQIRESAQVSATMHTVPSTLHVHELTAAKSCCSACAGRKEHSPRIPRCLRIPSLEGRRHAPVTDDEESNA